MSLLDKKHPVVSKDSTYNPGIKFLGYPLLLQYWKLLRSLTPVIVSVGSGLGTVESQLESDAQDGMSSCSSSSSGSSSSGSSSSSSSSSSSGSSSSSICTKLICVEPDPTSFQKLGDHPRKQRSQLPQYASVGALIKDQPELKQACGVFLNWPLPSNPVRFLDQSLKESQIPKTLRYDLEAIIQLEPQVILLVCETTGSSGSDELLKWLRDDVEGWDSIETRADRVSNAMSPSFLLPDFSRKKEYVLVGNTKRVVAKGGMVGTLVYRYMLLVHQDVEKDQKDLQKDFDKRIGQVDSFAQNGSETEAETETDAEPDLMTLLSLMVQLQRMSSAREESGGKRVLE